MQADAGGEDEAIGGMQFEDKPCEEAGRHPPSDALAGVQPERPDCEQGGCAPSAEKKARVKEKGAVAVVECADPGAGTEGDSQSCGQGRSSELPGQSCDRN